MLRRGQLWECYDTSRDTVDPRCEESPVSTAQHMTREGSFRAPPMLSNRPGCNKRRRRLFRSLEKKIGRKHLEKKITANPRPLAVRKFPRYQNPDNPPATNA